MTTTMRPFALLLLLLLLNNRVHGFALAPYSTATQTEHSAGVVTQDSSSSPSSLLWTLEQRTPSQPRCWPSTTSSTAWRMPPPLVDNYSDNSKRLDVLLDVNVDPLRNLLQSQIDLVQDELETQEAYAQDTLRRAEQHAQEHVQQVYQDGNDRLDQQRQAFKADWAAQHGDERLAVAQAYTTLQHKQRELQRTLSQVRHETQQCHADRLEMQCELVRTTVRLEAARERLDAERQEHAIEQQEQQQRLHDTRRDLEQARRGAVADRKMQLRLVSQNYTRALQDAETAVQSNHALARERRFDAREVDSQMARMARERTQLSTLVQALGWLLVRRVFAVLKWTGRFVLMALNKLIWQRQIVQRRVSAIRTWTSDTFAAKQHHVVRWRTAVGLLRHTVSVVWTVARQILRVLDKLIWQRSFVQNRVQRLRRWGTRDKKKERAWKPN